LGAGQGASGLRLPEDNGLAFAGGLKGERQADASDLEEGRAASAAAEAEETEA